MLKQLAELRSSMFAQIALLAIVVVVASACFFFLIPLWNNYLKYKDADRLPATIANVQFELSAIARGDQPDGATFDTSEILSRVRALNPDFRYYVKYGDVEHAEGGPPHWRDQIMAQQTAAAAELTSAIQPCFSAYYVNPGDGDQATAIFSRCDGPGMYIEFAGVETPAVESAGFLLALQQEFWRANRQWIIAAGGVFALVFAILFVHIRSIQRLARIAHSIDPDDMGHTLPESRLPLEVRPLVKAVNTMIGKVAEASRRERFFLSTAAHEMRTPLAALRTRLALLPEGAAKNDLECDMKRVVRLVDQLLRLMRIHGRPEYLNQIDLVRRCRKAIEALAPVIQSRGVEVVLEHEPEEFLIWGDDDLVGVAFSNLIENAVSFTPPGGKVVVSISEKGCVTVRDFGPGVSDKLTGSVFEPFAKFPPNRDGHGLGLAIVKAVADLHNARVSGGNAEGGGAMFSMQFEPAAALT